MGWFSGILQFLSSLLGLGEKLADANKRKLDEQAGENRVLAKRNKEAAETNAAVAKAAVSTDAATVTRLRNHGF